MIVKSQRELNNFTFNIYTNHSKSINPNHCRAETHLNLHFWVSKKQAEGYSGNAGDSLSQLVGNAWTSQVKDTFTPAANCSDDQYFTG